MGICRDCSRAIKPWEGPACATCGLPFASGEADRENICSPCHNNTYHFDKARSFGVYNYPLRELILHLKFRRRERWGVRLGGMLASLAATLEVAKDSPLIIPVPLHRSRERERGYNQAELLARGLRSKLGKLSANGAPILATKILARKSPTAPQSGLHQAARRENVRGAFAVTHPERLRGRNVILVDDVMTTGATVSACAAVLKRAGAQHVVALTLARATPQFPDADSFLPMVDDPASGRT